MLAEMTRGFAPWVPRVRQGGCHVPDCCIVPRPRILFNPAIYSEAWSLYHQILVDDVDEILQNDL
jgi:hypothetical protein